MIPFSLCQIILDASDYIQLGGIISSLIISIVSIYIALRTLKQNGKTLELNQQILKANREALDLNYKMLESTFRPYVNIYGTITNFGVPRYCLVIKKQDNLEHILITSIVNKTYLCTFHIQKRTNNILQSPSPIS